MNFPEFFRMSCFNVSYEFHVELLQFKQALSDQHWKLSTPVTFHQHITQMMMNSHHTEAKTGSQQLYTQ
jgi:hypothetical protein